MTKQQETLRIVGRFLLACSVPESPMKADFKLMSDLCFLSLPMKYRLSREEHDDITRRNSTPIYPNCPVCGGTGHQDGCETCHNSGVDLSQWRPA